MKKKRDLCKTELYVRFLRRAQISILEIFHIFLWLKSSPSLNLNKNYHFSMISKHLIIFGTLLILAVSPVAPSFFILPAISSESDTFTTSVEAKHPERTIIHLYFANKENSFLIAEKRLLVQPDDPAQMGKLIIESLIKGPKEELMRTISSDATLRALFVTKDKTAYVDLTKAARENHPGGCKSEMITIYSIVNSLVLNIPEIDAVKILIDGRESMTLAGHIDLRFPLKADMLLVR